MQEFMGNFEYKHETTEDGSPTLRLAPTWEPMHALDGAYTETLYIYAPTIADALKTKETPRILSVGLGLGYNEILTACEALKKSKNTQVFVDSYESIPELRQNFQNWIKNKEAELAPTYEKILALFAKTYSQAEESIKAYLKAQITSGKLTLHDAITPTTKFEKSQGILFDAFSSKSSPELWTEEFLNYFVETATDKTCYLSTYASKGTLHRTLRQYNFESEKRKGFGKKRESTFARREIS